MGSTDAEIQAAYEDSKRASPQYAKLDWFTGEKPRHQVAIPKGFYIGKDEVTQGQWKAVMGTTVQQQLEKAGPTLSLVGEQGDHYPMFLVNWNEAQDFVEKLNAMDDGYRYRLPTEAEWEYAARAGTTTAFAFGDTLRSDQANFGGNHPYNDKGRLRPATTPVGSLQPNAWGLYDMEGNAMEWVQRGPHSSITRDNAGSVRGGSYASCPEPYPPAKGQRQRAIGLGPTFPGFKNSTFRPEERRFDYGIRCAK